MLTSRQADSVLHIHGIYDSVHGIDNIIATQNQYNAILDNKGVQFIQKMEFAVCGMNMIYDKTVKAPPSESLVALFI